jgi:hypothetical protein
VSLSVVDGFWNFFHRAIKAFAALPPSLKMLGVVAALPLFVLGMLTTSLAITAQAIVSIQQGLDQVIAGVVYGHGGPMLNIAAIGDATPAYTVTRFSELFAFLNQLLPIGEGVGMCVMVFNTWLGVKLYRLAKSYLPTMST